MLSGDRFSAGALAILNRFKNAAMLLLRDEHDLSDIADVSLRHHECIRRGEGERANMIERALDHEAAGHLNNALVESTVDFEIFLDATAC